MNLVFVGFKHRHTGAIYQEAMAIRILPCLARGKILLPVGHWRMEPVCSLTIPHLNLCWKMIM